MKIHDLFATLGVAAATMACTLGLLSPVRVGAEGEAPPIKAVIAQPELTADGCTFVLTTDKPEYAVGEMPLLTIEATNPTDKPVATKVWVSMTAQSPSSRMSRVAILPLPIWSHELAVELSPGETKTLSVETNQKLPAGQSVSIGIADASTMAILKQLTVKPNGAALPN